jgi:hypothetical protein
MDVDIHIQVVSDASNQDTLYSIFLPKVGVGGLYDIEQFSDNCRDAAEMIWTGNSFPGLFEPLTLYVTR